MTKEYKQIVFLVASLEAKCDRDMEEKTKPFS